MTPLLQKGFDALLSSSCKRIIAWSQCAADMQRDLLSELPSDTRDTILDKMIVLHPPQELLVEQPQKREYSNSQPIRFILIGDAFFRKGGIQILHAFKKLVREENLPVKLVLVTSFRLDHYAAHETVEDQLQARLEVAENSDWIEHYQGLPNSDTLDLIKGCDVGLLPTWADTYGLSVLETQACGCPVITTDVRALPEINNTDVGWLIRVPKNDLGEALYHTPEEREKLSQQIQTGLEVIVRNIAADPSVIYPKGLAALERIRQMHNPDSYAQRLREIYHEALN